MTAIRQSAYGLENYGMSNTGMQFWNLPREALYEQILARGEGYLTQGGAVAVTSGKHTARAASDKFIVRESSTGEEIWWGEYNMPISVEQFNLLLAELQAYFQGRDVFVQDGYVGVAPDYQLPIRVVGEYAWHALFTRNMFSLPNDDEAYRKHIPEFTVICAPAFEADPAINGTRSGTFILLNFEEKLCLIGGSAYGGEIKKAIFTVVNFLFPREDVLTMHCSANVGGDGDPALFFGLSGTGKTTLSADPGRNLVGDDEHGWSEDGIFNFEGGCYAKVIRLSEEAEPQIYACTQRFGTILENVIFDPDTRMIDLDDAALTQNTRASYPLSYIGNALLARQAGQPRNIVFLTCDASGVMPPIARLTANQALYQFISGYTSKVGGTEAGVGAAPEKTFSTCFGAPFMVHHPSVYARLLKTRIEMYDVNCWLLNTGWIGGAFGTGERISIRYTRALLNAALDGRLEEVQYDLDPVFGFQVPQHCPGVPADILNPGSSWDEPETYLQAYRDLARDFIQNFKRFEDHCPREWAEAGPKLD